MFRMWDIWNVKCLGYRMFCYVRYSGCGMFGMGEVLNVGYSGCGMF